MEDVSEGYKADTLTTLEPGVVTTAEALRELGGKVGESTNGVDVGVTVCGV